MRSRVLCRCSCRLTGTPRFPWRPRSRRRRWSASSPCSAPSCTLAYLASISISSSCQAGCRAASSHFANACLLPVFDDCRREARLMRVHARVLSHHGGLFDFEFQVPCCPLTACRLLSALPALSPPCAHLSAVSFVRAALQGVHRILCLGRSLLLSSAGTGNGSHCSTSPASDRVLTPACVLSCAVQAATSATTFSPASRCWPTRDTRCRAPSPFRSAPEVRPLCVARLLCDAEGPSCGFGC